MNPRENHLRTVRFERPQLIPIRCGVSAACLEAYPQAALRELKASHPLLFPGYEDDGQDVVPDFSPWRRAGKPWVDHWGCTWETATNGITGAVTRHPLADWAALDDYMPPSPERHDRWATRDWKDVSRRIKAAQAAGALTAGSLAHGHTFLQLTYLRGYENLLFDMVDEHPQLNRLIELVETYNMGIVERFLALGVDQMGYPEDLGMQRGPMLSPDQFRRWILPSYRRLMAPAQAAGCLIAMHSDGDIRQLAPDLLEVGVDILNLQDLVNGIDWIAANLKGRVCIDLDIDRQQITRFGTPREIDQHIRQAVETLGSRDGGLMMLYGLYPGTPLENVKAVMDAMETYATYYA